MIGSSLDNGLAGADGRDLLIGGQGADSLFGMNGDDRLSGGAGADSMYGGEGADVFVFTTTEKSFGVSTDRLSFHEGEVAFDGAGAALGDLSTIDAVKGVDGDQAFNFGGTGTGELRIIDKGRNSIVQGNTDGDRAFEFVLVIEDRGVLAAAYSAADFVL